MSKLTLSMDSRVIRRAKDFAKKTNRSLSEMVEAYLDKVTREDDIEIDDELDQITGILDLPDDFDDKAAIREYLIDKHA